MVPAPEGLLESFQQPTPLHSRLSPCWEYLQGTQRLIPDGALELVDKPSTGKEATLLDTETLLVSFAQLQALEDARLVVQEVLLAATLPPDHPLAEARDVLANGPLLLAFSRLRAGMLVTRLEAGYHAEVVGAYVVAYTTQFLRSLHRELRIYLAGAYQVMDVN